MNVSIQEVSIVVLACILVATLGRSRTWLWGIPAQLAVISTFTPADPISTLLIGLPCSAIYAFALLRTEKLASPATIPADE